MDGEFFMENPMNKWMIWGVKTPLFLVQHPYLSFKGAFDDFFFHRGQTDPVWCLNWTPLGPYFVSSGKDSVEAIGPVVQDQRGSKSTFLIKLTYTP